jgi:triosephosphate isomerase
MRTRFLIANWKIQLTDQESVELAEQVVKLQSAHQNNPELQIKTILCPTITALSEVNKVIKDSEISLGAQDVFWEDKGAYTGEISPLVLKKLGCAYCLVGHSERRTYLHEDDEMVRRKVAALLRHNINPIICVGETREERLAGKRDAVIIGQVRAALNNGEIQPVDDQRIIIAYEPVWVIGSGQAVAPTDAAAAHHLIREVLRELYLAEVVEKNCFIIYGGSVNAENLAGFLTEDVVEGALVGGASLKVAEFKRLAELMSA